MSEWGVLLNGVYLSGGDGLQWEALTGSPNCSGAHPGAIVGGCLTAPPEGLGLPGLRTEDVTYPQRDGVRHFSDWYEPRIINLEVAVGGDGCGCEDGGGVMSARRKVQQILKAWSRLCDDTELVVFTDCHGEDRDEWANPPACTMAVTRTNLVGNPSFEVNLNRWSVGANATLARSNAWSFSRTWSLALTSVAAGNMSAIISGPNSFGVTAGVSYTLSAFARASTVGRSSFVGIRWYDAANALISTTSGTTVTTLTTTDTRLSVTGTAPVGAVKAGVVLAVNGTAAAGEVHRMDAVLLETGSAVLPYFDGATPDSGTYIYNWTATADDSTSTLTTCSDQALSRTNLVFNPSFEVDTAGWAAQSNVTIAQVATPLASASEDIGVMRMTATAAAAAVTAQTASGQIPVTAGLAYSAQARFLAGSTSQSTRVLIQWLDAADASISVTNGTSVADGTGAWVTSTITGAVAPAGAVSARVRTQALTASAAGEIHYVDRVMMEEGSTVSPYIDGNSPDVYVPESGMWNTYDWTSTDNFSTSVERTQPATFRGSDLVGPFGIPGRPRQATVVWDGPSKTALVSLRWDAVDHRMYVLDECGTPGSGGECVTLTPDSATKCRNYPRCYNNCYSNDAGGVGGGPVTANVTGTECASLSITLSPGLNSPRLLNLTTGQELRYNGLVNAGEAPVMIDTQTGTATQGGARRTHLLSGDTRMTLVPGENELQLISFGASDDGNAVVCWRGSVVSA